MFGTGQLKVAAGHLTSNGSGLGNVRGGRWVILTI